MGDDVRELVGQEEVRRQETLPPFQRISAREATTCTQQEGNTGLVTDRVTAGRRFGKSLTRW